MPQPWHVANNTVLLELDRLSASVNPLDPSAGLSDWRIDQLPLQGFHPLRVELPAAQSPRTVRDVDYYVRGGDLIVTYAEWPEPAMRAQFYWRAATHDCRGAIAAVEWVVSVQTDLLDSCPRVAARTDVAASEAFQLGDRDQRTFRDLTAKSDGPQSQVRLSEPYCFLFRLPSGNLSYAEMVMPAASRRSQWERQASGAHLCGQLTHQLFADKLEKGVLLRTRILGVVLNRAGDQAATARHYASFLSEDLPLTT